MLKNPEVIRRSATWLAVPIAVIGVWIGIRILQMEVAEPSSEPVAEQRPADDPPAPVDDPLPPPEDNYDPVAEMDDDAKFLHYMNLGKAYLEKGEHPRAIEVLTAALELDPRSVAAKRNMARAQLFSGKLETALEQLEKLRESQPDAVATTYLIGVAHARLSHFDEAVPYFEQAARLDANPAAIRFQLAKAYEAVGQHDKAVEQLEETIKLDPQHTAAHYRLAMQARQAEQMDQSRQHLQEYIRLRDMFGDMSDNPMALVACIYTEAELPEVGQRVAAVSSAAIDVRFTDATDEVFVKSTDRSAAAVGIIEMDDRGRYTLLVPDPQGGLSLMALSAAGQFERKPLPLKLPDPGDLQDCIIGNFHDEQAEEVADSFTVSGLFADVMMIGRTRAYLLMRTGPDVFQDVTESAGLAGLTGHAAEWIDWEHDGDLDLVVARQSGLELWQNNGNGTFSEVAADVGIPNTIHCVDVEAVDLDSNGAVDFVAARGAEPTLVYENLRAGRMAPMPEPPGPWPAARRVLANDVNNDGHPDVVLVSETQADILLGQTASRQRIDFAELSVEAAALLDYDNDGWLDLCGVGKDRDQPGIGRTGLWRNNGSGTWIDVSAESSLDAEMPSPMRDVTAADFDGDGDTDLLLLTSDSKLRYLRNDGGHINGQLKVRLFSLLMGNRGGIGTQIEVREGDFGATRWVQREWPVEIGLNGRTRLDAVRTVWPDGVVRSRTMIDRTGQPLDLVVTEYVSTGSCPYLYVWGGDEFRFVTDLLGSGALGVPVSREELEPVNPRELVVVGGGDRFRPRDGAYTIKITNEQRETDYLDFFKLLAVDHPPDVEIHSTDMLTAPPFSPSKMRVLDNPLPPIRAEGDDGIDRTEEVQQADGRFAPPGPILPPPLRGVCRPMALTLDFGPIPTDRPLVLALTGWTHYGTSSSNIALSQNPSVQVTQPRLEAETSAGDWVALDVGLGLPAGKTKTILCELDGRLPPGAKRLRLTTTHEIRWDRIALLQRRTLDAAAVHELKFNRANLDWRGFSEIGSSGAGQPPTPDYRIVSDSPPWHTSLEGWHTRYGDVYPLVAEADSQVVLLNGGDVLTLHARADDLPPVPRRMNRTFLLYSVGWNKEGDPNTFGGDKVEPLPGDAETAYADADDDRKDWRIRYNTRWIPLDYFHPHHSRN
jgi:tetratricopeptide (TPR) repeat protein